MQMGGELIESIECLPFLLCDNRMRGVGSKLAFVFVENSLLMFGSCYDDTVLSHMCCGV